MARTTTDTGSNGTSNGSQGAKSARTILITGATSGIGRHGALHLARKGHRVFATGRNRAALQSLSEEASGLALETLELDVTDAESIARAVAHVDARTGGRGLDVLVNNAGYGHPGPVDEIPDAAVRAQYETNVFGLLAVTRAFVPAMRARGQGRIVNVSSVGGRVTLPLLAVYNSTKYAVEALSDGLRIELKPFGLEVAVIEPGVIDTGFASTSFGLIDPSEAQDSPYAFVLERAEEIRAQSDRMAVGPEHTSRAIEHAATSRRPRARYVTPFLGGRVTLALARAMPTRVLDWVLGQQVGLTRRRLEAHRAGTASLPRRDNAAAAVRGAAA